MELSTVWFIVIAVLWTGYFVLEGFDFGVGMLLPVLGRGARRRRHRAAPPGHDQHHRPAVGRQRGVAAHRGRRDVRGLPALVRHVVQRLLPAAAAHPRRAHRAQPRLRVPPQAREHHVEVAVGPRHRRRVVRAGAALGRGLHQHRPRRADRREQGVRRQPLDAAQPDGAARRARDVVAVPRPRRPVRGAEDGRPDPRGRPPARRPGSGSSRRSWPSSTCSSSGSSRARPPRGSPPSSPPSPSSARSGRTCATARAGRSSGRSSASPSPWRRCSSRCSRT